MRKLKTWELGRKSAEEFKASEKLPLVIILDNVRSAYNVGAVFRTADAFAVSCICLCGFSSTPPHPEMYKTALGAEDTVTWKHYSSVTECIREWKNKGYTVVGVEQTDSSIVLQEIPVQKNGSYAVILGNEVDGVQLEALEACDLLAEIPQEGTKHSLNISVAAGIILWEFFKKMK